MTLDIAHEKGTPLDRQQFTLRELAGPPYSKLDDDAFTRVRAILMTGIEAEAVRFGHACARMNRELRVPLAQVRQIEQHQRTLVNWLNPPDQSTLETTIGFEQAEIEITAAIARREPDPILAQVYRLGMLEDFDHLYRFSALLDRLHGKDANAILQSYTDIRPGRATAVAHRALHDDVRRPYDRTTAKPLTKFHAITVMAAEQLTCDYYQTIGPQLADPVARALYAEIASVEEQHVTQYESLIDPTETWLEKWLLHEATEVYNYWSCLQQEPNDRARGVWERFVDYELGHLHVVMDLMRQIEQRDPAELLPATLPDPLPHEGQRVFIRETLARELVSKLQDSGDSLRERQRLTRDGSPSTVVAAGYRWLPGTELADQPKHAL
jgi:rubrerythrin